MVKHHLVNLPFGKIINTNLAPSSVLKMEHQTGTPNAHNQAMLYKFKSKAAGDVIMLEANGQRVLEIIGKSPDAKGIILPEQMQSAIDALQSAIAQEEAARDAAVAQAENGTQPRFDAVSLRQRAHPFIAMLKECLAAKKEIVWGV